jgi:hypothetical protein
MHSRGRRLNPALHWGKPSGDEDLVLFLGVVHPILRSIGASPAGTNPHILDLKTNKRSVG